MDKKISYIKDRVLYIAKYKNISYELFCDSIGVTYGNFKGPQKKTSLKSDTLDKILSIHDDISAEWLILGKGNMIKENKSCSTSVNTLEIDKDNYIIKLQKERIDTLEAEINFLKKELQSTRGYYSAAEPSEKLNKPETNTKK